MNITLVILAFVVVVGLLIGGPFFTIAAVNTLFGAAISYNFWTWLAALWVNFLVAGRITKSTN